MIRAFRTLVLIAAALAFSTGAGLAQNVSLMADRVEIDPAGFLRAEGSVEIFVNGAYLRAEALEYDQRDGTLDITGPLILRDDRVDAVFLAEAAELDAGLRTGILKAVRLVMGERLQLAAQTVTRPDDRYVELGHTVVSSCQICVDGEAPLWQIRADKIIHDRQRGRLFFTRARMDLGGVPVVFLPKLSIPAPGTTRATGFLVPVIEPSSLVGSRISTPFFVTLGPSADVTLTPVFARDGNSLGLRLRRAFNAGLVELNGAATIDATQNNALRGYLFSDSDFLLGRDLNLNIHTEWATDIDYPLDYEIVDTPELTSQIEIDRTRATQDISLRAVQVESLRDDEDPYRDRLPDTLSEFDLRQIVLPDLLGGTLMFGADANARYRSSTLDVVGRDVARLGAELTWDRTDVVGPGLVLSYGAHLRADSFAITDDVTFSTFPLVTQAGNFAELRWPLLRVLPEGGSDLIEPFLRWDQNSRTGPPVPNADSRVNELDFGSLLRRQQFSGREAVDDGWRAALGGRWQAERPNGYGWSASIGRIIKQNASREFSVSEGMIGWMSDWLIGVELDTPFGLAVASDALLGGDGAPTRIDTQLRFDSDRLSVGIAHARIIADDVQNRTDPVSYLQLGGEVTLSRNWTAGIDYGYDLTTERADLAAMRFQFQNECMGVDLSLSHRLEPSASLRENLDLGFEVSLLGLGGDSRTARRACINDGSFVQ